MIYKIFSILAYLAMITINFLANYLPLNNRNTGEISDAYPNLFAPAGYTFSIWGLIYLLLLGYIVFQFLRRDESIQALIKKINPLFIATSLTNFAWIFAWHYDFIAISVLLMLLLLFLLIKVSEILRREKLKSWDNILISSPFYIYFGWITVATIANITVFLVSINWNGFGLAEETWMIIVLLIGAVIGTLQMNRNKSIAYGLVLIWAYAGILSKHLSAQGFDGRYPGVIATVIFSLALLSFFTGRIIFLERKK